MRYLSTDDVVLINKLSCGEHQYDFGLLDSAVAQARHYRFENPYEVASAYLFFVCKNHPFTDGNKRTALLSCSVSLLKNGYLLQTTTDELYDIVVDVTLGNIGLDEIYEWIKEHC